METPLVKEVVSPPRRRYPAFLRKWTARVGIGIVLAFIVMIAIGPYVIPYAPLATSALKDSPPSLAHPFGTDFLGHDLLSQIVFGAYPSMIVGVSAAIGAVSIGLVVGVVAGYFRRLEGLFIGMTDIVMTFPPFPLMVLLGSISPATNTIVIVVLTLVTWPPVARSIRSQVMAVKQSPYIETSKLSGMGDLEIIFKDVIPEILSIAIAYFVLLAGAAIVLVVGLQYLGIGNPDALSWGSTMYWAQQFAFYSGDWWWILAPGLAITILVIGFALIGFSVEEALNPRLRVK
jgi:peptide/nickel transport system permease protein